MRQKNTHTELIAEVFIPTSAKQSIKYAKTKANRAKLYLESVESQIRWSKGDNVIIYRPSTIVRGH